MTDKQRIAMIQGQLLPAGVVNESLLKGFSHVDREFFIDDENDKKFAYSDRLLGTGDRALLPPATQGLLLESLSVKKGQKILVLAGGCGYEANLLATTDCEVWAVVTPSDKIKKTILRKNFHLVMADGIMEFLKQDKNKYDSILLLGLVERLPQEVFALLKPKGLVATIMAESSSEFAQIGNIVTINKNGKTDYLGQVAGLKPLAEFTA